MRLHFMRSAIITCNNAINHGAALQTVALVEYLLQLGHEVEVIDYLPPYMTFATRRFYNPGLNPKEWAKLFLRYAQRRREIERHREFLRFKHKLMPVTCRQYGSVADLRAYPPEADLYIAGSDQIWNPLFPNGSDPSFYLDFGGAQTRRISYAASFAVPSLPSEMVPAVAERLNRLDAVSVREESGKNICDSLGVRSEVVCDPVLLHTSEFWDRIADSDFTSDEDYLLVYDFERSPRLAEVGRRVARMRGLKIYSVGPWPLRYADKDFSICGPRTFVSLIAQAKCVLSNSLHGTIFALIYKKDFFIVGRNDGLNERMRSLLHRYALASRYVSSATDDANLLRTIDYGPLNIKLAADIHASKLWLKLNTQSLPSRAIP